MDNASLDLASREILTLITPGYRPPPTYSSWLSWLPGMPPFTMTAVDAMRRDYQVKLAMAMKVVPVMKPQFGISGDPQVVEFVESELRSIWTSCITDITEAMWYTRFGCEMVYKRADDGMVRFCRMMPFHPRDFHILTRQGEITGLKVIASNNTAEMDTSDPAAYQQGVTACENDKAIVFAPKSFVYVHNRKFGSYEGCSELEGAFQPWMEKVREGGAISSRSLWFYKCAFDSGIIKHPPGMYVSEASGVQVPYRDIALKVGESVRNGATIALESTYDASGHPAWDYVRAQANQGGDIILQLIDHLDGKINKGAGIPDDVIEQVSGTGSYAGRTIPFIAFLEAGTPTVRSISKELVRQVLMPLAQINFGESRGKDWEITEAGVNTAEFLDDGSGTVQGDGDGDGIPNEDMIPGGEDNSGRGVPQQSGAQSQGVQQMSLSGEDRRKLSKFRRQFSGKSVSFVREGRAAGRTQVQVQFSVADEPFSHGMMGGTFDPLEHPRGDDGKFIDAGRIQLAKGDPRVAKELRGLVTGASEAPKLEKMLGGKPQRPDPESNKPQKSSVDEKSGLVSINGKPASSYFSSDEISAIEDSVGDLDSQICDIAFASGDESDMSDLDESLKSKIESMASTVRTSIESVPCGERFTATKPGSYFRISKKQMSESDIHGNHTSKLWNDQFDGSEKTQRRGLSSTASIDDLVDYFTGQQENSLGRGAGLSGAYIVEIDGDPSGDSPYEEDQGERLVTPKSILQQKPVEDTDFIKRLVDNTKRKRNPDGDGIITYDPESGMVVKKVFSRGRVRQLSHFDPVAHPRDESGQFIISAMRSIEPGADRGALVTARDLRKHFGASISKQELDAAMLALAKAGKVSLHHHDYPASLKPEDLDQLISYPVDANHRFGYKGSAYAVGANIRQNQ